MLFHYPISVSLFSLAPSPARSLTVTRVLQDGVELNWLPPTEPNGEVHYVIEYKREDSGDWTSVNTTSDSTHYNLTGLHSGTNYTVRVVAVNSNSYRMVPTTPTSNSSPVDITVIAAGAAAAFLLLLTLLTAGVVIGVVVRRVKRKKAKIPHKNKEEPEERGGYLERVAQHVEDPHYESTDALGQGMGKATRLQITDNDYEIIDGEGISAPEKVGLGNKENSQKTEKPTGNPNVLYMVVDKSKKATEGKTQEGSSATTTQKYHTAVQHYECIDELEQGCFRNVMKETSEGSHGEAMKRNPNPNPKPRNPNVVYAEVDKSKKRNRRKMAVASNLTAEYEEDDRAENQSSSGREVSEVTMQKNDHGQNRGGKNPTDGDSSAPSRSGLHGAQDIELN